MWNSPIFRQGNCQISEICALFTNVENEIQALLTESEKTQISLDKFLIAQVTFPKQSLYGNI